MLETPLTRFLISAFRTDRVRAAVAQMGAFKGRDLSCSSHRYRPGARQSSLALTVSNHIISKAQDSMLDDDHHGSDDDTDSMDNQPYSENDSDGPIGDDDDLDDA